MSDDIKIIVKDPSRNALAEALDAANAESAKVTEPYCDVDCSTCAMQGSCKGCVETEGRPFGGECICAECVKAKGKFALEVLKQQLVGEFNDLEIKGMPQVEELVSLCGAYVNLEYELSNGQKVKFLDDSKIYLGYQLEKSADRCFGLVADKEFLLVCEYGLQGENPELVVFKKRSK